ncbi:hypothetical protein HF521_015655 [Silurus meridionalis]|uniref:Leucine-rich repeat-containing protein 71 n=1 Tax=Silurus meridionalis TaxID=175797 RepID=A0A8T0A581_SILME|nr:hypothetical protein HF521_015655 [Silurus meridionalis]
MKKRMEKVNKEKGTSGLEEETSQIAGLNKQNTSRVQNIDDYQCTGDLRVDIPELCASVGLKEIPDVRLITTESPSTERAPDGSHEQAFSESCMVTWSPKPCLHIEMENEEPRSVKRVRISGWKVDEKMAQILSKALPSLSNLQSLEMWQTGLTDPILTSMKNTVFMCSKLRTVFLEGTPIPENSYHILMAEDSLIAHLSLRNNHIGEDGARLISLALCKSLLSLNLAFNAVGNVGATYLAQGLRLNRTLLYLSLANNHIGDAGAAQLAQVFGPFALTHEEIVERRRELKKKEQLDDTKKDEKPLTNQTMTMTGRKEDTKGEKKKTSDTKLLQGKGAKSDGKDKQPSVKEQETDEVVETQSPLLDPEIQTIAGKVIYPGNTTLLSLNLSGNELTQQSLQMFLQSVACKGQEASSIFLLIGTASLQIVRPL